MCELEKDLLMPLAELTVADLVLGDDDLNSAVTDTTGGEGGGGTARGREDVEDERG